jgi:hypothetical protein
MPLNVFKKISLCPLSSVKPRVLLLLKILSRIYVYKDRKSLVWWYGGVLEKRRVPHGANIRGDGFQQNLRVISPIHKRTEERATVLALSLLQKTL